MEGVLFIRKRRGKLLRRWQRRYVVLTAEGTLKEYAESTSAPAIAGSGMALKQEHQLHGARVATLPFPLVGRPHAFRLKQRSSGLRLTLAAKSNDQLLLWLRALKTVCAGDDPTQSIGERMRSAAISAGRRSGSRRSAARAAATAAAAAAAAAAAIHNSDLWGRASGGWDRGSRSSMTLPRSSEQDFWDTPVHRVDELERIYGGTEWYNHRLRAHADLKLSHSSTIHRGSMIVAINGISLQTLREDEVVAMMKTGGSRLPVTLRWLKSPHRRGVLKCKLCYGLTTQLKTLAMYRNGLRAWQEQLVEIDGDVLTCQVQDSTGREANRSVIPLVSGCTVKAVHELVADQRFCFLVSLKAYSMLFQANSEEELHHWIDAIQRAINIAEGCIPGFDMSLDGLQRESSVNMRHRRDVHLDSAFQREQEQILAGDVSDSDTSDSDDSDLASVDDSDESPVVPAQLLGEQGSIEPQFEDDQLSGMLEFLQRRGRFVEALQLMTAQSSQRKAYWQSIFQWAMEPVSASEFADLLNQPLNPSDSIQVQKDVPRTAKWLSGSAGSPQLDDEATRVRLESLTNVLHAFLSSCDAHVRTDARTLSAANLAEGKSFYMQGMNGIAFIVLDVIRENEVLGMQVLRGIISHILPHVFGIKSAVAGGDHFDLFSSLIEVGNVLQEVVQMHLPNFHDAMEAAGLPTCLLAYKWFPTMFSDISIVAHQAQLRYDTLLAIWDVCLLMGLEGMFCVALALFSAAEEEVLTLKKGASTEVVTGTIINILSVIEPHDLIISVCEVLELCSHPVLLKLRNGHRRRLQVGNETRSTENLRTGTPSTSSSSPLPTSLAPVNPVSYSKIQLLIVRFDLQ